MLKKTSQQSQQITKRLLIVGESIVKNIEPHKMKKKQKQNKICYNGKMDSWSNNRGNDPPCQRLYG